MRTRFHVLQVTVDLEFLGQLQDLRKVIRIHELMERIFVKIGLSENSKGRWTPEAAHNPTFLKGPRLKLGISAHPQPRPG